MHGIVKNVRMKKEFLMNKKKIGLKRKDYYKKRLN
jgi:hypothetical protein